MSKLIIVLCIVAVLVLGMGIRKVVTNIQRKHNKKKTLKACEKETDTIFVMLVSVKDAVGAARTMASIFAQAACPLRVYIGLYEFHDTTVLYNSTAMGMYESLANASADVPFSMQDHIRVLRAPVSEFKSAVVAREQLQRFLYRSEVFVLSLNQGCTMAEGWDTYFIQLYGPTTNKLALTTIPERAHRTAKITNPGTFVGVGGFKHDFPRLLAYRMKYDHLTSNANVLVPAIAWSASLSFTRGPLPYAHSKDIDFSTDAEDLYITMQLLDRGWQLAHVPREVACMALNTAPYPVLAATSARVLSTRHLSRFGANPWTKTITARARLGLVPAPNKHYEISIKVGSTGDFLSMLSRIEMKQ
jgi:hypothetical protein